MINWTFVIYTGLLVLTLYLFLRRLLNKKYQPDFYRSYEDNYVKQDNTIPPPNTEIGQQEKPLLDAPESW